MDRATLLRKLDELLEQAARERRWGSIEIEIRDGEPKFISQTKKDLLTERESRALANQR